VIPSNLINYSGIVALPQMSMGNIGQNKVKLAC